ncbi:MAG: 50S ribosomal protein L23 [Clostridiales bacterium]|nr:50S ribosomal protein L23 [Clostridiales bacterium]
MKDVILEPVVTEKVSALAANGKTYVFKVNKKANKYEIKDAVEKIFGVKVVSVNTLITKPKDKRVGKYTGKTRTYKKAIITLKDGDSIEV